MADVFAPWSDPQAKPLIQFKNVTKQFGAFTAIDGISLDIYPREFFALLGPSGCGKTTLMRMLAGFEDPTEGQILLDGQNIAGVPPNRRATNMMFQSYALFPHLTVRDNIAFGLKREGKPQGEIDARVDDMLRLVQLGNFATRKPHQISGGQKQRVALARALAKAPKLLLLDEPLGALDKKLRQETQFELMDIQEKTGTTFVIVTHDQEEAMTVASRVAVMDLGQIKQVATPTEIYEAPNSRYVADFIGDVTLIEGTAAAREKAVDEDAAPDEGEDLSAPEPAETDVAERVEGGADATEAPEATETAETAPDVETTDAPADTPETPEAPPAPAEPARLPQPNALGRWLHDRLLKPVLGPRKEAPRRLPPPSPGALDAPDMPTDDAPVMIPPGGVEITWADGQPALIASNGDPETDGKTVTLALRPEKVAISKSRPLAANALEGKVLDIAYLGNISTYHVELDGGGLIKAQIANTERTAQRDITWEDRVWVSFAHDAGVVLDR